MGDEKKLTTGVILKWKEKNGSEKNIHIYLGHIAIANCAIKGVVGVL